MFEAVIKGLKQELQFPRAYRTRVYFHPPSLRGGPCWALLVFGPTVLAGARDVLFRLLALEDGLNVWRHAYADEGVEVDGQGETFVGVFRYEDPRFVELVQRELDERMAEHDRRRYAGTSP